MRFTTIGQQIIPDFYEGIEMFPIILNQLRHLEASRGYAKPNLRYYVIYGDEFDGYHWLRVRPSRSLCYTTQLWCWTGDPTVEPGAGISLLRHTGVDAP